MSVLVRRDGTQFVMQAHRERLFAKKKSQIAQKVRALAGQKGHYVRLLYRGRGQYDAAFATEPGYLLGESIRRYFNAPENLIYCEALPDSAKILLVVIREGLVYFDSPILAASVQSELLPLMTDKLIYRIVTSGNVPLRKAESFGTFRFPKDLIESFEVLEQPLFPRLPALRSLQLQPLSLALKLEGLRLSLSTSAVIVLASLLIVGGWWLLTPDEKTTSLHPVSLEKTVTPYAAYFYALSSPAPGQQLTEIMASINALYFLPGWRELQLTFAQQEYHIHLMPHQGGLYVLRDWARRHDYKFQLSTAGVELLSPSRLPRRAKPTSIYHLEQVLTQLVDQFSSVLPDAEIRLSATEQRGEVKERHLTLYLTQVSPGLLDLVGRQLNGLPVVLSAATLQLHSGLLSGSIQLSVWGK